MSNLQSMIDGYAAYSRRDFSFVDTLFAADIEWQVVGLPLGTLHGRKAILAFFDGLAEQFAGHEIALRDHVESDDRLVCMVEHVFTRHDGGRTPVAAVHAWTFRNGEVAKLYEVGDTLAFGVASGAVPAEALGATA